MSSLYVRQLAESWVNAVGTIPFHQTINESPNPSDDIWLTLDFQSMGYTKDTYCGTFVEDGEITLIFFGRVGIGYETLFQAAEDFANAFMLSADPGQRLVLNKSNPPNEFSGRNDPWFIIELGIEYQLNS